LLLRIYYYFRQMLEIEYTLKDIDKVAKQILKYATFKTFLFKAEMGAGKTTLIKALIKALGCKDVVRSPTFSLVNEYKTNNETIFHFDLYRLENENELYDFGFEDYLQTNAYVFIEWPEIATLLLTKKNHTLSITTSLNNHRFLKIS